MIGELAELLQYKDLLKQLVVRDLKVRYKNSVLGFFWSLANPLVQVATITIMVKYVMRQDIPNYSAYLLVGFLPWIFLSMTLMDSSQVVLVHRDLLKKVYFPREVLPLSVVISNLIHFLLSLVVFFIYLIAYIHFGLNGRGLLISTLWLPLLITMQLMLVIGLTSFISCLNVFFEDTKYLLSALLNVFFYLTPIMYPAEFVYSRIMGSHLAPIWKTALYKLYLLNPVNMLVDAYRKILLPPFATNTASSLPLDYAMLAVCGVMCALVAVGGYLFFNSRKWIFAERA